MGEGQPYSTKTGLRARVWRGGAAAVQRVGRSPLDTGSRASENAGLVASLEAAVA